MDGYLVFNMHRLSIRDRLAANADYFKRRIAEGSDHAESTSRSEESRDCTIGVLERNLRHGLLKPDSAR